MHKGNIKVQCRSGDENFATITCLNMEHLQSFFYMFIANHAISGDVISHPKCNHLISCGCHYQLSEQNWLAATA